MRIFKFGGASVQDAPGVKNVSGILKKYGEGPLVVVISAMGKTTNALEDVLNAYWEKKDYHKKIAEIKDYHINVLNGLFEDNSLDIYEEVDDHFLALELYLDKKPEHNFDLIYDQVISYGEVISTRIVSTYLLKNGIRNKWVDARNFIITDNLYREARILWDTTTRLIRQRIPALASKNIVITQGFIGSTQDNLTTTLGREGSDYTASIFANALDAEEVVIWKDVPGILNADPKKFSDTVMYDELSYEEAVEMTYYGARVLHPKTIKPLQNKNIPLNVKSFIKPAEKGTIVKAGIKPRKDIPVIISKPKQLLLTLCTRDYSFIAEENIKDIFDEVVANGINVNLMNNSAISFHICIDDMKQKVAGFIGALEEDFAITRIDNLELLTVKYGKDNIVKDLLKGRKMLHEQKSGETEQYVVG